jgi:hypothetical protein
MRMEAIEMGDNDEWLSLSEELMHVPASHRIERGRRKIKRIVARVIREVMAEAEREGRDLFWWVFERHAEALDRVMAKISDADGLPVDEDIIAAVVANTLGRANFSRRRRGRRRSKSRPA